MNKPTILVPMAGLGSRFINQGFQTPKPLVTINNITMIEQMVNSLGIDGNYIYVVQKDHLENFDLLNILQSITPNCSVVAIDEVTNGAAKTCLFAKDFIDESELVIVDCDQIFDWNNTDVIKYFRDNNSDCGILVFHSNDPKWSYAIIDNNNVTAVAEKISISNNALYGFYYWKNGKNFIRLAERMIEKNINTKGEFYVAPVFNEAIIDKLVVHSLNDIKIYSVGTPEDLKKYIEDIK